MNDKHEIDAAVRGAKRAQRPGKIGELKQFPVGKKRTKRKRGFDKDFADRGAREMEGMRAKKGQGVKGLESKQPKGAGKKRNYN